MPIIPLFLRRPSSILRIPDAISRGLTVTRFIDELKSAGLSYRKSLMLADWRTVSGIEARKDTIKYVRKDRLPSAKVMPDVEWELSKEYMYKVNTWSRLKPDDQLTERFVNVMSDVPMSPSEVEEQVTSQWGEWERYAAEKLEGVHVVGAYHRIDSPLEED